MERIEINERAFDWKSLLRHVSGDQASVEVTKDDVPIARIDPIRRSVPMSELGSVLSAVPSLEADLEDFEKDIHRAMDSLSGNDDPWAS